MAKITPYAFWQELDDNGAVLAGGKLYTYEAGTSTPKATYTDSGEGTANANPVILDASGRADIWLESGSYKFVLKDSADVTIATVDNITGDASNVFGSSVVSLATNTSVTGAYKNNVLNCTASLTLSLLDVATAEEGFLFSVKNSSAGNVTIDPDGSELIDGASTVTIYPGQSCIVVCTGTAWIVLYQDVVGLSITNAFTGTNTFSGKHAFKDAGELTISTGAITITGVYHTIDTESDAASDDLDTINGGSDGELLIVRAENTARTVVIKDGTGNINTMDGNDLTLDDTDKGAVLIYDSALSAWRVLTQIIETSTTDRAGTVEKATEAEMEGETADKFPDAAIMKHHPGVAKAWVCFDGTGTPSVKDSYNVSSSITDNGAGDYTFTFTTALADANYVAVASAGGASAAIYVALVYGKSTTGFSVYVTDVAASPQDLVDVNVIIMGAQ